MPDLDPREILTPDEAELRVLREAIMAATDMLHDGDTKAALYILEDAPLEADAARCLAERYPDE